MSSRNRNIILGLIFVILSVFIWLFASWLVSLGKHDNTPKKSEKVVQIATPKIYLGGVSKKEKLKSDTSTVIKNIKQESLIYHLGVKNVNFSENSYKYYTSGIYYTDSISGFHFLLSKYGNIVGFITSNELSDKAKSSLKKSYKSYKYGNNSKIYIGTVTQGVSYSDGSPLDYIKDGLKHKEGNNVKLDKLNEVPSYFGVVAEKINKVSKKEFKGTFISTKGTEVAKYFVDGFGYVYYEPYASYDGDNKPRIQVGDFVGFETTENIPSYLKSSITGFTEFGFYKTEGGYLWMKFA